MYPGPRNRIQGQRVLFLGPGYWTLHLLRIKILGTESKVLGSQVNCKQSWETMIRTTDLGYKGLVSLATRVFYSLGPGPEIEEHREDIVQEALVTLYLNAEAWDMERGFVSWASVVFKNSMIRSMNKIQNLESVYDPQSTDFESDADPYLVFEDNSLAHSIYSKANEKTQKVLDKIMDDRPLSRNDYYTLAQFRERVLATHE